MFSGDDRDKEVLLQADNYPVPSPSGLHIDMPSTTPTLPQADLATAQNNGGKRKPCRDG